MLDLEEKAEPFRPQLGGLRALVRRGGETLFFYFAVLAFGLITAGCSLIGTILYPLLPARASQTIGPRLLTGAARCYLALLAASGKASFDLGELDRLRDDAGLIIAPNHPTMLDAIMVISRLPRIVCISKAELWSNPFLAGLMRMSGYIPNDTPVSLTKAAVANLEQGRQLLLFPEGTRTTSWPVNAFQGGFALMAKMAGVSVQTVFIETNSSFLNKGWPLFKQPRMPVRYKIRLGRRFELNDNVKQFTKSLEKYFQEELGRSSSRTGLS